MIYINAVGALNALGNDLEQMADNLARLTAPGMRPDNGWLVQGKACWTGNVDADLPAIPDALAEHNSRNNQLLLAALAQIRPQVDEAIARFGSDRVAVIMGTSTSGLDEADRYVSHDLPGYFYLQQELGDPSRFLAAFLGADGPAYTLSTACSSSARALISGQRLIDAGLADAAIVGGADTLSRMPLNGFDSLESLSSQRCAPFSQRRDGITIGEGAALMLIGREPDGVALLGAGESSDAHHMSAPHPEGEGAARAIEMALRQAGLRPEDIGYINLHGTATRLNDQIEAKVIHAIFGDGTPCSSTKYLTGHTLGAAGICEAAICWLLLTRGLPLPPQDFSLGARDETLPPCGLLTAPGQLRRPVILSNSFAFGGNNACLILGKADG
ncbi:MULTISPECIES: beta-ketoacyl-[acyl-carrier-protein] synthase family protein [unclassified Brenneria]|uniref:beta-ketoacyl-[acyl-carrier-protein] synthase family protein n=1 Tax=unclassified Brenneria TaxID=2634434 RepID=UPI0015574A0B|nr:beta-ketoacyl-[acyl-carrier-protein] synthase family protein [Brenneria sp. hezel4-2-4]MEE3651686.1 beta-ketoacyl-[acyl-carrier-protein] synthase family protein [Brenneria sp. HEZEL_4_2_4]NPD01642.1 beta-ketoacyl-[acyl-carrier-protein] synthase family protein [Brenneria sp. hezel4-2-4]